MSEGEKRRLIAWDGELSAAHDRLRRALQLARDALAIGDAASPRAELMLYCHGFCTVLSGHHGSEDVALFPELSARYPALRPTIAKLTEDHELIATLIERFDSALASGAEPDELLQHLEGIAAIMESHFQFEERRLLDTLARLDIDADPASVLGPV